MNRELKLSLMCFLFVMLASHSFAEVNLADLVKEIQSSIVTVITHDKKGRFAGQGSGFFIDKKGHLITNYHVLNDAYAAKVKTYDGKIYPIKYVAAENETMDLIKVLVDIPVKPPGWAPVAMPLPSIADRIFVIGSPMGLAQTVSEGIVSSVREIPEVGTILQISAPISPGSSGAPVVNMKGQVVGVVTFYLIKGQNLNFAIPSRYLIDLKTITKIPPKSRLFVHTEPEEAGIRILNIKPKFYQGIILKPGRYHVEVSANGYEMEKVWIKVEPGKDKNITVALKKLKPPLKEIPVDPNLVPSLPPTGSVSFDDILKSAEEKKRKFERATEAWNKWQGTRNREFKEVKQIDKDPYISLEKKIEAWSRFIGVINTDNPFSNQDDDMRVYSRSRLSHWQSKMSVPPKPPADVATISPKDHEIEFEGRFIKYENGVVKDTKTGLEWIAGPDKATKWDEAKTWTKGLIIDGKSWRLPSIKELETLYKDGLGSLNITPLLKTTGWWIWSEEIRSSSSAFYFDFQRGYKDWFHNHGNDYTRALAVHFSHDKRFIARTNGIVFDKNTSLEWLAGPDKDLSWYDAKNWVASLSVAGGGWRMPTVDELATLYQKGAETHNMTPLLKTTGFWVWSGETKDYTAAWGFTFGGGGGKVSGLLPGAFGGSSRSVGRAFAVRGRPKVNNISSKQKKRAGRFIAYDNGTVKDTETGLMWASKDNRGDINWRDAKRYCENYRGGGYTDWRMPTEDELAGLYDKSESYQATQKSYNVHLTELIVLSACCPWASETRGSLAADFNFDTGNRSWIHQSISHYNRTLPVRSGK